MAFSPAQTDTIVEPPLAASSLSVPLSGTASPDLLRKAAAASFIGNFVEWFDYATYGYFATAIAAAFFPDFAPAAALLATFAVFAVSFVFRPVGGIIWGHFGDRVGRRSTLSLSILIMSGATFVIAFLPSYRMIGLWAPVLLLLVRVVQGFSASGEYAGASAFIAEYAPVEKRGFYTSLVPASTAAGLLFGSLLAALLFGVLPKAAVESWGWRLPFLLAAPLGLIGRYIRVRIEETPHFRTLARQHHVARTPLREVFAGHRGRFLIALGVACLNAIGFYVILSYMPTYLSTQMGVGTEQSFLAATVALVTYIGFVFLMGTLSDRHGRKTMLIAASVLFAILTVPLFALFGHVGFGGIVLIQVAFGALLAMNDGTLACFLSELFPTRVRYTGFAFSFNLANALFGGTAPFVATWLIGVTGNKLAPGWYLVLAALVALGAMLGSRETAGRVLED